MFEKFTNIGRKVAKRTVADAKRTVKEELVKSADDIFPTVVGIASIALLLLANVPPQKLAPSTVTINNYYFAR